MICQPGNLLEEEKIGIASECVPRKCVTETREVELHIYDALVIKAGVFFFALDRRWGII